MAQHVHGLGYHRPDNESRGRCVHTSIAFGCLVQCDSPNFAGSLSCVLHYIAEHFGITETEAAQALADYYAAKADGR